MAFRRQIAVVLAVLLLGLADEEPIQLSFSQAIEQATASSRQREHAVLGHEGAQAKRYQALAQMGPKLRADYAGTYYDEPFQVPVDGQTLVIRADNVQTASLTILQPVLGIVALSQSARMARLNAFVQEAAVDVATADVAYRAAELYLRLQQARKMIEVAQRSVDAAGQQAKVADSYFRAGKINKSELLRLKVAHASAQAEVTNASTAAAIAQEALRQHLNLERNRPIIVTDFPEKPSLAPGDLLTQETAEQMAFNARPEIRQANLQKKSIEAAKLLAMSTLLPSLNFFARWDFNLTQQQTVFAPRDSRSVGFLLGWDIWENGASLLGVRDALTQARRVDLSKRDLEEGIRFEVFQSLAMLKQAKDNLALAQARVEQADEAYRIESVRFKLGVISVTDLMLSESSRYQANGALVAAINDVDLHYLKLKRAIGEPMPPTIR